MASAEGPSPLCYSPAGLTGQATTQIQPGFMVQRRTQQQVATQTAQLGQTQQAESLLAVRRQPSLPQVMVGLIAGSLLLEASG